LHYADRQKTAKLGRSEGGLVMVGSGVDVHKLEVIRLYYFQNGGAMLQYSLLILITCVKET